MSQHDETHGDTTIGRTIRIDRRIRSAGFFAIFIALMMGLTALAMHATESNNRRIQQRVAAEAAAAKIEVATTDVYASEFTGEPAQTLALEKTAKDKQQQPASALSTQAAAASLAQKSPACDQAQKAQAVATKSQKLRHEANRHKRAVWSIRTSGLVTRFLNPGMHSYRLSNEKNTHAKKIQHIGVQYQKTLRSANCL